MGTVIGASAWSIRNSSAMRVHQGGVSVKACIVCTRVICAMGWGVSGMGSAIMGTAMGRCVWIRGHGSAIRVKRLLSEGIFNMGHIRVLRRVIGAKESSVRWIMSVQVDTAMTTPANLATSTPFQRTTYARTNYASPTPNAPQAFASTLLVPPLPPATTQTPPKTDASLPRAHSLQIVSHLPSVSILSVHCLINQ